MAEASIDAVKLLAMTRKELDALFKASEAGPIPNGQADGTVIIAPGTVWSPEIADFVNLFAWLGKTFDASRGKLTNRILPFVGATMISAEIYRDQSWLDGRACIVLDYRRTSLLFSKIRDEIRLVGPQLYLGRVYWHRTHTMDFCLQFPKS